MQIAQSRFRAFLREYVAVVVWVTSCLTLLMFCNSAAFHYVFPNAGRYSSTQLFLCGLVPVMAIWEMFGFSLGSPINPAVTVCFAVARKIPASDALQMCIAQFLAHISGVLVVRHIAVAVVGDGVNSSLVPPQPHEKLSQTSAIVIELCITCLLCVVALSLDLIFRRKCTLKKWSFMTAVIIAILASAGKWTGSCMNPAMAVALGLLENRWRYQHVYWIGPICGAVLAGYMHQWYVAKMKSSSGGRRASKVMKRKSVSSKRGL